MIKFYGYNKCSTCIKAKKFLKDREIPFKEFDITLDPPSKAALTRIVKANDYPLRKLFNTSGMAYREMDMKSKFDQYSESELLELLSQNGRLVKRPIVLDGDKHTVGFNVEKFEDVWS